MTESDFGEFHRIESRADRRTGLRAVFALHDLTLGPATGGVRRWRYASEDDAVVDAMRLARGMTRKNALAGLPFGGGKAVIMSDGAPVTKAQLRVFGRWIDELGGEYISAEDVGMRVEHMVEVRKETRFVTGIGDRGLGGHPGPKTARGVFRGIEVSLGGSASGARVAVQGLGAVGMALAEMLAAAGARLVVTDLDADRLEAAERLGAKRCALHDVLLADVDVVAPCALGQVLTPEVARALKGRVVAGSANNQLASDEAGRILHDRGIRYAPDYVINAGGIISAGYEYLGWMGAEIQIDAIGARLEAIYRESAATREPTHEIAERMAAGVIDRARARRTAA